MRAILITLAALLPLAGLAAAGPLDNYPTKVKPAAAPQQGQAELPAADPLGNFPRSFAPKEAAQEPSEAPATARKETKRAPAAPVLATPANHDLYKQFWPKTDEPWLDDLKDQAQFYTFLEMPGRYQVWDEGKVNSGLRNVETGNNRVNANLEFPWADAAGTQASPGVKAVRFVCLPDGQPIEWRKQFRDNGTFDGIAWKYPAGTIFGELLLITDPATGLDVCFELRTREKEGGTVVRDRDGNFVRRLNDGRWTMNSYRPFPTVDDLAAELERRGAQLPQPTAIRDQLTSQQGQGGHRRGFGFSDVALRSDLPLMSANLVRDLLENTAFTSARHKAWVKADNGMAANSPTGVETFGIVPKNFAGTFIPVNNQSCMRCHQDAGKFVPAGPEPVGQQTERRWRVRGSDGILSFHIFNPNSFGPASGGVSGPDKVVLNERLVQAGMLVHENGAP